MGCKARAADCRIDNNERFYMAQIQKGTTYGATAPDNLVTYTNLNAHVDSAVLLPGAITDQTTLSSTATGDYALVSDTDAAGALKKVTLANLIPDSGIATAKIADDAVTNAKLADDAVDSPQIADGAIDAVHLASDSVTTAKILDGNVTAGKLASDAVTTVKILDGNVTAAKLASTLDLSGKTLSLPASMTPLRAVVTGRYGVGACPLAGASGIASVTRLSSGYGSGYAVQFSSPLSNSNYIIQITPALGNTSGLSSLNVLPPVAGYTSVTQNGFTLYFYIGDLTGGCEPAEFRILIWP